MAKQPNSGDLHGLYSFQKRGDGNDGLGGIFPGQGPFAEVFKSAGRLVPLTGSETIIAGRLEGRQPYRLTIRSHAAARTIDASWHIVDVRTGKGYYVKSPISDADMHNQWLDMLVQEGGVD